MVLACTRRVTDTRSAKVRGEVAVGYLDGISNARFDLVKVEGSVGFTAGGEGWLCGPIRDSQRGAISEQANAGGVERTAPLAF
jgi:hypothetical protein